MDKSTESIKISSRKGQNMQIWKKKIMKIWQYYNQMMFLAETEIASYLSIDLSSVSSKHSCDANRDNPLESFALESVLVCYYIPLVNIVPRKPIQTDVDINDNRK